MPWKGPIFLLLVFGLLPCSLEASQIAPNPNTGTIDIVNDPTAFNNLTPFINLGEIIVEHSSTLTNNGTLTNDGTVQIGAGVGRGASVTNAAGAILNNYASLTLCGGVCVGVLTNAGTLNNFTGATLNAYGDLTNTGTLNNFAGATLATLPEGSIFNAAGGILNNYGTLSMSSFGAKNDGIVNNFGSWAVETLASNLTNSVGAMINNTATFNFHTLENLGTLINTGSMTSLTSISNSGMLINTGSMTYPLGYSQTAGQTVNNGTMTSSFPGSSVSIQGGSLRGTGTINALVIIAGGATLAPGTPFTSGTFTINGNLQSSGNLLFRISPVIGQFDVLRINGTAAFTGGTMSFSFLNFTPHIGDSWDFLYATAISGWDSLSFLFSGLGADEKVQFHFHDGIETMRIVAVPEPSSIVLVCAGLAGIVGLKRKK